jgi:hypothetical protein
VAPNTRKGCTRRDDIEQETTRAGNRDRLRGLPGDVLVDVSAQQALATALTFHASFDNGADADFGLGDKRVYTAPTYKNLDAAQPGLHARFFLNGKLQGSTEPIPEPFTWDLSRAKIRLGVVVPRNPKPHLRSVLDQGPIL